MNEEDTVTVGQDLLKLETGGDAKNIKKPGGQTPKSPASDDQPTSSHPEPPKDNQSGGHIEKSQPAPSLPLQTLKEHSSVDVNQYEQKNPNAKGNITSDLNKPGNSLPNSSREERRVFSMIRCTSRSRTEFIRR